MTSFKSARSFLFWLHTWCGLNITIYLGILFLSGTLLVFAPELEAIFDADRRAETTPGPLPAAAIYDNITAQWPDARIDRIERAKSGLIADRTTLVTPWGERALVWSDPQSGAITGLTGKIGFKDILRIFHDSLLTQHRIGNLLVTLSAPVLILLIVTGLISYRRFWRGFLRLPPRDKGPRAFWGGLHRLTALWSLPFLIIIALSGFYFFLGALGVTSYHYPKPAAPVDRALPLPDSFTGADLAKAIEVAQSEIPGLEPEMIVLPVFPDQSLTIQGQAEAFFVRGRANKATLDPTDMSVLGAFRAEDLGPLTRIREAADSLHFGIWGGLFIRILWFMFGALATGLCFFGAMIYARRMTNVSDTPQPAALRLVWRGMFPLKWLLPLGLILGLGGGSYLYLSKTDRWMRVPTYSHILQTDGTARLFARGQLRSKQPLPLRLRLNDPQVTQVTLTLAGQDPSPLMLETTDKGQEARFEISPTQSRNSVTITLPDGAVLTWYLGVPVF